MFDHTEICGKLNSRNQVCHQKPGHTGTCDSIRTFEETHAKQYFEGIVLEESEEADKDMMRELGLGD